MFADVVHSSTPKEVERNLHEVIARYSVRGRRAEHSHNAHTRQRTPSAPIAPAAPAQGASPTLFLFDDLSDEHAAAYHAQHNGTIRAVQRFGRLLAMESN